MVNMKRRGSMTIEATFIVPICFFTMIAFLYMAMYLCDCYTMETVIRTAVQRELRYMLQEESVEEGTLDWAYWGEKTLIWSLTANLEEEKVSLPQEEQDIIDYKSGIILMALTSKVPIVPIYMEKRTKWYKRQRVVIGDMIDLKEHLKTPIPTMEDIKRLTLMLHDEECKLKALLEKE